VDLIQYVTIGLSLVSNFLHNVNRNYFFFIKVCIVQRLCLVLNC